MPKAMTTKGKTVEPMLNIGTSKTAVIEARKAIMDILNTEKAADVANFAMMIADVAARERK